MAAELPVVHLKIGHRATGLTPPTVATQDLLAQTLVRHGIQPQGSGFGESFSERLLTQVFELCATTLHNRSLAYLVLNVPKAIAGLEFAFLRRR